VKELQRLHPPAVTLAIGLENYKPSATGEALYVECNPSATFGSLKASTSAPLCQSLTLTNNTVPGDGTVAAEWAVLPVKGWNRTVEVRLVEWQAACPVQLICRLLLVDVVCNIQQQSWSCRLPVSCILACSLAHAAHAHILMDVD
jgi:hypothetical protein